MPPNYSPSRAVRHLICRVGLMQLPAGEYKLCIIIPCYNNLDGLILSLQSVRFSLGKYLIIVVDDGSQTPIKKENITPIEADLKILRIDENGGIVRALNEALCFISNEVHIPLIARLDCGDICDPERFEIQVKSFYHDAKLTLVGSWCRLLITNPDYLIFIKHPQTSKPSDAR